MQRRVYCTTCNKDVVAEVNRPSHLLHFFLSLFTMGLWLPIWILLSFSSHSYCPHCAKQISLHFPTIQRIIRK